MSCYTYHYGWLSVPLLDMLTINSCADLQDRQQAI